MLAPQQPEAAAGCGNQPAEADTPTAAGAKAPASSIGSRGGDQGVKGAAAKPVSAGASGDAAAAADQQVPEGSDASAGASGSRGGSKAKLTVADLLRERSKAKDEQVDLVRQLAMQVRAAACDPAKLPCLCGGPSA